MVDFPRIPRRHPSRVTDNPSDGWLVSTEACQLARKGVPESVKVPLVFDAVDYDSLRYGEFIG